MSKKKRSTNDSCKLDPSARNFVYDEVDDYNDGTNSDEDIYGNSTKVIKTKTKEEHVLGIGGSSSDDSEDDEGEEDSDENVASEDDDEEENSEEDCDADSEANLDSDFDHDIQSSEESDEDQDSLTMMGKKKQLYFGTDLKDERVHKASKHRQKKEDEAIELEMQFAREQQMRLRKEIEDDEAHLVFLPEDAEIEEPISTPQEPEQKASSKASAKGLNRVKKTMPEVIPILTHLKEISNEVLTKLSPLMEAKKNKLLPPVSPSLVEYLETRYALCLNYATVVSAYMSLKCSGADMSIHPATTRLAQFNQLFKEMEVCREKYDSGLAQLVLDLEAGAKPAKSNPDRKILGVVREKAKDKKRKKAKVEEEEEPLIGKRSKKGKKKILPEEEDSCEEEEEEDDVEEEEASQGPAMTNLSKEARRKITYQIAKNKGLMPSRSKEQRNPRVKYKNKYKNKLVQRKGQVREVRKELKRYGGEISGIKANVVKSIQLK